MVGLEGSLSLSCVSLPQYNKQYSHMSNNRADTSSWFPVILRPACEENIVDIRHGNWEWKKCQLAKSKTTATIHTVGNTPRCEIWHKLAVLAMECMLSSPTCCHEGTAWCHNKWRPESTSANMNSRKSCGFGEQWLAGKSCLGCYYHVETQHDVTACTRGVQ